MINESEKLEGIYIFRSGIVNGLIRTSLFRQYEIQKFYPGCTYGALTFFAPTDSVRSVSKFTLKALTPGEYFFIKYSQLKILAQSYPEFDKILQLY